jgi:hypothetical protein
VPECTTVAPFLRCADGLRAASPHKHGPAVPAAQEDGSTDPVDLIVNMRPSRRAKSHTSIAGGSMPRVVSAVQTRRADVARRPVEGLRFAAQDVEIEDVPVDSECHRERKATRSRCPLIAPAVLDHFRSKFRGLARNMFLPVGIRASSI